MNLDSLKESVITGKAAEVEKLTREALSGGTKPQDILKTAEVSSRLVETVWHLRVQDAHD